MPSIQIENCDINKSELSLKLKKLYEPSGCFVIWGQFCNGIGYVILQFAKMATKETEVCLERCDTHICYNHVADHFYQLYTNQVFQ